MSIIRRVAAFAVCAACAGAQADITFSFADPGGGRQLANTANGGGAGIGRLSYDPSAVITFIVDTGIEGVTQFENARLEFSNMKMGESQALGMFLVAPVQGSFTFYTMNNGVRQDIVTGTSTTGAFVHINSANAIMFSSANGFLYSAGPALTPLLGASAMTGLQDAVFTVTDVLVAGGGPLTGAGGAFNSFTANTSFSGNSQTIPATGVAACLILGLGLGAGRRR